MAIETEIFENTEHGAFTVPTRDTHFGPVLEHGLPGDKIIYMYLPHLAGWRTHGFQCMSHQTYEEDVYEILDEYDMRQQPRMVKVVDIECGEHQVVWARDDQIEKPEKGGKTTMYIEVEFEVHNDV